MFESLGKRLGEIFGKLRRSSVLTQEDVNIALREIRIALLEADVALSVVRSFLDTIKEKAIGQEVLRSVAPGQLIVKIVHDQLVSFFDHPEREWRFSHGKMSVFLIVGLQGSGKTTMTGKIAHHLVSKCHKKVYMASLDTQRPAAREQLGKIGETISVPTLAIDRENDPLVLTKRAMAAAHSAGSDVLLLDTAGRLHIHETLMEDLQKIIQCSHPSEVLFVADALAGQEVAHVALAFHQRLSITGIALSKMDGDSRGGAALSVSHMTEKPLKFLGTGERPEQGELFDPKRLADRILDMGDIVAFVEKAHVAFSQEDQKKAMERMQKGLFTLEDLLEHLHKIESMGGIKGFLGMLPGMGQVSDKVQQHVEKASLKKQLAIIHSMTPQERKFPHILDGSRKTRIASGSGTRISDINRLLQQYEGMRKMFKQFKGPKGLLGKLIGK